MSFWVILCPFSPLTTRKIKILKLKKKTPDDIITLQLCIIDDNHMMYGSWDMERNRQNFLSFWTIFCPNSPKYQNFEKILKISGDIIILHMCTINYNHMYGFWDIKHRQNFFVILDHFLLIYPLKTQKSEILKKWKKCLDILSFYTSVPKIMIICYIYPEIWHMMDVTALLPP